MSKRLFCDSVWCLWWRSAHRGKVAASERRQRQGMPKAARNCMCVSICTECLVWIVLFLAWMVELTSQHCWWKYCQLLQKSCSSGDRVTPGVFSPMDWCLFAAVTQRIFNHLNTQKKDELPFLRNWWHLVDASLLCAFAFVSRLSFGRAGSFTIDWLLFRGRSVGCCAGV